MKLYLSSILLLVFSYNTVRAQSVADTLVTINDTLEVKKKEKPKEKHFQYFRVGVDVSKFIRSALTDRYSTAEFLVESIWKEKMHYLVEGGFASATLDSNIKLTSSSYFARIGFDKYFFGKLFKQDLDNAFVGVRLGGAYNSNSEAIVKLWDPYYGNTTVTKPAASQMMYWIGLTAGFRMEVYNNIFVGWNIRGKTFINPKIIQELTPEYLAGYGIARKQPSFDYNLYLLYGFGKR